MPAFGGSALTSNRTFDTSQDGATPKLRSLNVGGMSSPAALPGTNGVQTEVITGDWQQKITGSATVHIDGNSDTTIHGNSGTTVHGDVAELFNQNCTTTVSSNDTLKVHGHSIMVVHGAEHNTTLGPTLETRIGEHTQVHQAPEHNQDQSQFDNHMSNFSNFGFRYEADGILGTAAGGHTDLVGRRLTAGLQIFEFKLNQTEAKELEEKITADLKAEFDETRAEVHELRANLTPATLEVNIERTTIAELYVIAGPPVMGSILDALIAEFALSAAF